MKSGKATGRLIELGFTVSLRMNVSIGTLAMRATRSGQWRMGNMRLYLSKTDHFIGNENEYFSHIMKSYHAHHYVRTVGTTCFGLVG